MNRNLLLLGTSLLGLTLAASLAQAADDVAVEEAAPAAEAKDENQDKPRGFYAVGTIGGSFFEGPSKNSKIWNSSTADSNNDGRPDAFTPDSIGDENNFLWGIYGGYRLADWLGAEVGYTDIGGFHATDLTDPGNTSPHDDRGNTRVSGVEARLRAWMPLGHERIQGIGGLGIFIFDSRTGKKCKGVDTSACDAVGNYPPTARKVPVLDPSQDSGQAFTISAGLQFKVTENVLLRTEYQHFFEVLDQGVDMVTLSVVVGFYDFFGQGKSGGGDDFGGIAVE